MKINALLIKAAAFYKLLLRKIRRKSISRISLDILLRAELCKIHEGIVLDIGAQQSPYRNYMPVRKFYRFDIDINSKPDMVCDIHYIGWRSNFFDTVVATEVLEHCYSPDKAVNEIYRVLKKGGTCVLSTRFIYPYHGSPFDYYRFTWDSLYAIFNKFDHVAVYHHGNKLQTLWQIVNGSDRSISLIETISSFLNPIIALIHVKNTTMPLGFVVVAVK